jgi:hypothetical protein
MKKLRRWAEDFTRAMVGLCRPGVAGARRGEAGRALNKLRRRALKKLGHCWGVGSGSQGEGEQGRMKKWMVQAG